MAACPQCKAAMKDVRVLETRATSTGMIRRRRKCLLCQHRWTTREPAGAGGRFAEGGQPNAGNGTRDGMSADNPFDRYGEWVMTKWNGEGVKTLINPRTAAQLLNAALGLMGEGGELADLIKKLVFHQKEYDIEVDKKIKLELGDIAFYLFVLCKLFDFDPSEVFTANMVKLNSRYPSGFDAERSNNRDTSKES
jgi:NTP pyrophosphatase (non-canonical NTP hydrolase)